MKRLGSIAKDIDHVVETLSFADGTTIRRLSTEEQYEQVKNARLGMDRRAPSRFKNLYARVFDGLDFDSDYVRSQAYVLYNNRDSPVAISTFVIEPQKITRERAYAQKKENGIWLDKYPSLISSVVPDFTVSLAWTKTLEEYRGRFARQGWRLITESLVAFEKNAPQKTMLELGAQGSIQGENAEFIERITQEGCPRYLSQKELPFALDLVGKNARGSNPTVKLATMIGAQQKEDIGAVPLLGPVFFKELR